MSSTTRFFAALAAFGLVLSGCTSSSPYQGLDDEQLYAMGLSEYEEGDFDNAAKALDRLLLAFGASDRIVAARLLLGHAYYGKGDFLTARSEYTRFLDRYAGHPDAPEAALGVCRSLVALSPEPQRDQAYTMDAMSVCRNVVVDYAGTEEAGAAADLANQMRFKLAEKDYLNADFYFRRKLFDSAIIYFEAVADRYPETEWAPKALLGLYRSNLAIGYEDLAEDARQRLLTNYPDSEEARSVSSDGAA
jgi:outer membrane protein assembly factor BamD